MSISGSEGSSLEYVGSFCVVGGLSAERQATRRREGRKVILTRTLSSSRTVRLAVVKATASTSSPSFRAVLSALKRSWREKSLALSERQKEKK